MFLSNQLPLTRHVNKARGAKTETMTKTKAETYKAKAENAKLNFRKNATVNTVFQLLVNFAKTVDRFCIAFY